MIRPDRLAQLRAERDAETAAQAARVAAEAAAAAAGIAQAHATGRHMAAEVLPWHRVAALAAERAVVNEPARYSLWVARQEMLAREVTVRTREEWVAFLDGVAEVATLV